MNRTKRSAILRRALLCFVGSALVASGSRSSTGPTKLQPRFQEPVTKQAKHACDIDGNLKNLEDCPSDEIIRQYREKYDLAVVLRGGVYWQVISHEYVNEKYGYRITLPRGVDGLCTPPPMPWHGFFIDVANELKPPADASANRGDFSWANWNVGLFVEAYYNSLDYASADDAGNASLSHYKKTHPDDLIVSNRERTSLRRLPAIRCVVQFVDPKSGQTMIAEELIAIRGDRVKTSAVVYTIGLTTTPARYREDERVLRQILKGFRLTKP